MEEVLDLGVYTRYGDSKSRQVVASGSADSEKHGWSGFQTMRGEEDRVGRVQGVDNSDRIRRSEVVFIVE